MLRSGDAAKAQAVTWLTAWDSQGVHRAGTAGDEAGARWQQQGLLLGLDIIAGADACGDRAVEVASEVFTLDRLDPVACYPEFDGGRISGVPVLGEKMGGLGSTRWAFVSTKDRHRPRPAPSR